MFDTTFPENIERKICLNWTFVKFPVKPKFKSMFKDLIQLVLILNLNYMIEFMYIVKPMWFIIKKDVLYGVISNKLKTWRWNV